MTILEALRVHWLVKVRGVLGPDLADDKEISILNRVVRSDPDGILFEADLRHVEKLLRDLDMVTWRLVPVPGVKPFGDGEADEDVELSPEEKALDRAGAARCNYLSTDRPDATFTVTE